MTNYFREHITTILFIVIYLSFSQDLFSQTDISESYKLKKIVIDAGHGGKDPGTLHGKFYEKDIALNIALKVGKYIKQNLPDVEVIYTRDKDVFVNLHERGNIANKIKADLFISIHVNSNRSSSPHGASTYVLGLNRTEASIKENSVILKEEGTTNEYDGYDMETGEITDIMASVLLDSYLKQSLNFAQKVQDQFTNRVKRKNRGVKQAGFLVLWKAVMPSVLIEVGFLSNPKERQFLISETGQDLMASGIYRAFRDYKQEIETKISTSNKITQEEKKKEEKIIADKKALEEAIPKKGIWFMLQVYSSKERVKKDAKRFKNETITEIKINEVYKYTIGKSKVSKDINKLKKSLKKKFPDSFMIAFKDGEKISTKKAIKESKKK